MGEYAQAGVDYKKLEPFKRAMVQAGRQTLTFPNKRDVFVNPNVMHAHGAVFKYGGGLPHDWCKTQEGLGNLNWIAEWMYAFGDGKSHYDVIARAAALLIAIDVISQGAMPVIWTDEVAAGDGDWFQDERRSQDYADGCVAICQELGMALPAGESPALKYLVNAKEPVKSAPTLSGSITGIIAPDSRLVTGVKLQAGDSILGVPSSGLHSNGISLVIRRVLPLSDAFMTRLPNGNTVGEECLIPVRSYVALVEALLENEIDIHALLPGTGGGVGKIAFDERSFTYRVHTWVEVPILFQYMRELGVTIEDCLTTFNWGIGYYIFVPPCEFYRTIQIGRQAGYNLIEVGRVEEGERKTIFEPEGITLPPPGE